MLTTRYAGGLRHRRGFISHAHGALHVRWAGEGAPLVALHESPRSSLSLLPLLDGLREQRTVIAFDTPGYGHSDPLPSEIPEPSEYVAVFEEALSQLGLDQASLYATHTGAAFAVGLALAKPNRVRSMILDGFAAFDANERPDFLGAYLSPFEPAWDGSHVAYLWSRCKDLFTWFPCHQRNPENRLAFDPPSHERVHDTVLGFLMSGSGYSKGYRCAGLLDAPEAAAALRVPTTVTARPHDLIRAHLDRLTPSSWLNIERIGPSVDDWLRVILQSSASAEPVPALTIPTRARSLGGWDRVLIELGEGYVHVLDRGAGDEADVVLPDMPDTALRVAGGLRASGARRVIVIDPPGCGASDPLCASGTRVEDATVQALRATLDALGVRQCRMHGMGFGAILAERLRAADSRVTAVTGSEMMTWATGEANVPDHDVVPTANRELEGGALFTSWYRVRDRFLYHDVGAQLPRQRTSRVQAPSAAEVHERYAALWIGPECAALASSLQAHVRAQPDWHRRICIESFE